MLICGLLSGYLIYRQGVKDGIAVSAGGKPEVLNPVTHIKRYKEDKQEKEHEEQYINAFGNLMSYTGETQKEGE